MKTFAKVILLSIAPYVYASATPPPSAAGYTISVNLYQAQQCSTELYQEPTGYWYDMPRTSLRLEFPASGSNQYTAKHPHNDANTKWPDIKVSYDSNADSNEAYVKIENPDFSALLVMKFSESTMGTAQVYLHEDGLTHHMRHVTFSMEKTTHAIEPITLPEIDDCDGDPQMLDDGMFDIIAELEERTCTTAADKLYRKRLLALLPLIQMSGNPDLTLPETKGNTALHYACSMSHTTLVQWLVDHGANTEAVTNKGATVDACVGGAGAADIKRILQQARNLPRSITPEQTAGAAGEWLEKAFLCKDITANSDIPTVDKTAKESAKTLFRYVATHKKHPFGVHVFSRMGRMLTWANKAKLSEDEFVDIVLRELHEARSYQKKFKSSKQP